MCLLRAQAHGTTRLGVVATIAVCLQTKKRKRRLSELQGKKTIVSNKVAPGEKRRRWKPKSIYCLYRAASWLLFKRQPISSNKNGKHKLLRFGQSVLNFTVDLEYGRRVKACMVLPPPDNRVCLAPSHICPHNLLKSAGACHSLLPRGLQKHKPMQGC